MAPSGGTDVYESAARCRRWRISETVSGVDSDGPLLLASALLPERLAEGRGGPGPGSAGSAGSAIVWYGGVAPRFGRRVWWKKGRAAVEEEELAAALERW
jgi:hypothetical protein